MRILFFIAMDDFPFKDVFYYVIILLQNPLGTDTELQVNG